MKSREDFIPQLIQLFGGRPVRWATFPQTAGDFDGNDRVLEVFNADAGEQRELLRTLRPLRTEVEAFIGGPVLVVFHTRRESERLYGEVLRQHELKPVTTLMDHLQNLWPEDEDQAAVEAPGELQMKDREVELGDRHSPRAAA